METTFPRSVKQSPKLNSFRFTSNKETFLRFLIAEKHINKYINETDPHEAQHLEIAQTSAERTTSFIRHAMLSLR